MLSVHDAVLVVLALDLAAARAWLLCRELAVEVRSPVLLGTGGPCSVRLVAPSDLFRTALLYRAAQLVIVHNHLDGGPPSEADRRKTRRLRALGAALGLTLIGHVIVGCGVSHVVTDGQKARAWARRRTSVL